MVLTAQGAARRWVMSAVALAAISALMAGAQTTGVAQNGAASAPSAAVVLDRVVAVVNGDVILESDIDEERRFEEIQPFR
jgi:peptidyl-prolyl cis-trans isomerase SurA